MRQFLTCRQAIALALRSWPEPVWPEPVTGKLKLHSARKRRSPKPPKRKQP